MLNGNCTEALSIKANVTISCSRVKPIENGIAPLPFPPALLKQILVHEARGEGQGEGTCSILCNVRVHPRAFLVSIRNWIRILCGPPSLGRLTDACLLSLLRPKR